LALGFLLGAGATCLWARGGGGCVAAGTLIDTPAGPRAVETLRLGDAVWSQLAGQRVPAVVQAVYAVDPAEFVELTAGSATLLLTPEHPVQTAPGVFVQAGQMVVAAKLFTTAERVTVTRIRRAPADRPAYNLLVSPGGVFFANGLLVHNKGCFLPETPITMSDGRQQPISTVRTGDAVLAFTLHGSPVAATVRHVLTHEVESYLVIRTATTELHVTEEHPFYVGAGTFKTIESLHVGDAIYSFDGAGHFVSQRLLAMERRKEHVIVYNLEVDSPHTYIAGGIAVHNKGGGCFAPGTLIATPTGPRPIELLHVGDPVLAPQADGRLQPAEVIGVYLNFAPLVTLRTDAGDLRTTDEHPLRCAAGDFRPAAELGVGAQLALADGRAAVIRSILRAADATPVYTLQVAGTHIFIADGFVVHNKGGGGGGFHSSGGGYRTGSGGGDGSPMFVLIVVGVFAVFMVYKVVNPDRPSADEDLDYCFTRSEIEPKAAKTRKLLEFIAKTDPTVDPNALIAVADRTFRQLQTCWSARDYKPMEPLMMPDLWAQHNEQLRGLRQNHEINRLEDLRVERVDLVHLNYTDKPNGRAFTALITAWLRDTYVDDRTGAFLRGDETAARFQEFWTFQFWENSWRLREIEQSRESGCLKTENFFESFTEVGRDQVYGETAGQAGPAGPNLPPEVRDKDANIDRLLNFLVVTDRIWDREVMIATARRSYAGVLLAWQDGRPEAFTGLGATPGLLAHFRSVNESNQAHQWRVEYRNLCVRKVEIVHINNRNDRALDEFTARISAHAQRIVTRADAMVQQDAFVTPWVEFWTFRRSGQQWVLSEILPAGEGAKMLAAENVDEGSSTEMLQWYYSKERAI
jgi:predicted lipid-binding transport protein (Tim44 family)